jgi:hypothetical protein
MAVELYDAAGKLVQKSYISAGATNTYIDTKTLYSGKYLVKISGANSLVTQQVVITK